MRYLLVRFCFVLLAIGAAVPGRSNGTDQRFENLCHRFTEDYLKTNPEAATQLGDHRFDAELSDYSPTALKASQDRLRGFLSELESVEVKALTGPNRVDAEILRLNIASRLFELSELHGETNDPLRYDQSLANGIYLLIARDFGPAESRLKNAVKRLNAIPAVIAQAQSNLQHPPSIYTETALAHVDGAVNLIREDLKPLLTQVPELKNEVAAAQEKAIAALIAYKEWLSKELLPRSTDSFRLGPDLFRKKLRFSLASDLSAEEILRRAEGELARTTEALYQTALPLFERQEPEAAAPKRADRAHVIKAVLDKLSEDRPTDATVVATCEETLKAATDFVRGQDLMTVPDRPLKIIVTPEFKRGRGVAYCSAPGALEPSGETFIAVEPTPANWPEARKVSFYREYNRYMLHDLMVHEAMPGHFLQIAHANGFKAPTLIRTLFWSGTFAEGWAVYTERVMADAGFGGPEVKMQQLKMKLRVIINAMLDQKLHMTQLTDRDALDLMMNQGFQEEGEAVAKLKRAKLSSGQLSTYFIGAIEHDDLRAAAEKAWGDGFSLKKYHDEVLAHGTLPVKFARQEMGL